MAVAGVPLINGVAYTHADIILNVLGFPIIGMTAIKYSDMQDITLNYGTGQHPASRGYGAIQPTASITLTMEEIQKISNAAPLGRIQNIPDFDIGVNFTTEAGNFTRHRLVRCRFKGRNTDSSVNNSQIVEELELSVVEIQYA